MRDILFRGRDEKGVWRYGYLFVTKESGGKHALIWDRELDGPKAVDINTVGQFTGTEDDKMNKTFEGDIVMDLLGRKWEVYFDSKEAKFWWRENGYIFGEDNEQDDPAYPYWEDCLILGNIHDNPELLVDEKK